MTNPTPLPLPSISPAAGSRGGPILLGALGAASIGSGLFLPLALVYFTALTEVPLALLGVILGAASAMSIPVPALAGIAVDRFTARGTVIVALLLQATSFLALVWVMEPVGIFLAAMIGSMGSRLYWSSIFTLIADFAETSAASTRTDSWFAWANIARTVGIGVGGLVTGLVIADGSDAAFRGVAIAACLCFAASAVAMSWGVRVPRREHDPEGARFGYGTMLRDRNFLALTALNSIFALSTLMLGISLPLFARNSLHGPAWLTSTLLVANAVLILLLGDFIVRRVAKVRRTRVLAGAALAWVVWSLGFAGIADAGGYWVWPVLIAATLIFTVGELLHAPASMAIAAAISPPAARGRYLAAFQYSWVAAEIVAPILFATLFEAQHALPFVALAAINAVGLVFTLLLEKRLPASALRS